MTDHSTITRRRLIAGAGALVLPFVAGGRAERALAASFATRPKGSLVLNGVELAQVRANIFDLELPFAARAWKNTVAAADNWLGYRPAPPSDSTRITDWHPQLYSPGLRDGNAAYTLGVAYAIGGRADHARRARDICLAWARTYRRSRPQHEIGHMVAEPVGPVIKLCMAFQLARPLFDTAEEAEFQSWAAQFVEKGKQNADFARDDPWVPDVTYGNETFNVAPYGNSATWQRAMAVWAAATVGPGALKDTLEWNLSHTTRGGRPYGWDDLVEGLVIDGAGGQLAEDRYRTSVDYGLFSWYPLVLIADLARRAGFRTNLFTLRTKRNGYTLLTPVRYYGNLIMRETIDRSLEKTDYGDDWRKGSARWRASFEVLYRNSSDPEMTKLLRRIVNFKGPQQRGDNYDVYITNYGAVLGRGPKGPMPIAPKVKKRRK